MSQQDVRVGQNSSFEEHLLARFDALNARFDVLDARLGSLGEKFDHYLDEERLAWASLLAELQQVRSKPTGSCYNLRK